MTNYNKNISEDILVASQVHNCTNVISQTQPNISALLNEDVLEALFRASRLTLTAVEQVLKEYGLCITEFGVLEAITVLGPQTIQVLAARVLVTSGSMTYTVNQLLKKELIMRKCCTDDARRYYLHLTPKGEELIKKAITTHNESVAQTFAPLSNKDKRTLVALLTPLFKAPEDGY